MEIFKIIPETFFNLLSGKNRSLYLETVFEVFKAYEQGFILGMDKGLAQQVIVDFLDVHPELLSSEVEGEETEDEEEVQEESTRDRANHILRRLEECEWIDIDVNNDYQEILNFRDYAITIIEALKTITQDSFYGQDDE